MNLHANADDVGYVGRIGKGKLIDLAADTTAVDALFSWECPNCGRMWDRVDLPNECECGSKPQWGV